MRRYALALVLLIFFLAAVSAVAVSAGGLSRGGNATPQAGIGGGCNNLWYGNDGCPGSG